MTTSKPVSAVREKAQRAIETLCNRDVHSIEYECGRDLLDLINDLENELDALRSSMDSPEDLQRAIEALRTAPDEHWSTHERWARRVAIRTMSAMANANGHSKSLKTPTTPPDPARNQGA